VNDAPGQVTMVLAATAGGTGAHVRMLAAGLAARGISVQVAGPDAAGRRFGFTAVSGVSFTPLEIGGRPRPADLVTVARLRWLLLRTAPGRPAGQAAVHAHGLRAGSLTVLALLRVRGVRRPRLVVTVHNAPPGGAAAGLVYRLLERIVARGADLVLCVSGDLEQRMRAAGPRPVERAVIAAPAAAAERAPDPGAPARVGLVQEPGGGFGYARPVVLAVGRLAAQKNPVLLLDAAVRWQDLDPRPRLVIAGEGPLGQQLRAQAAALGVDAVFPGHVTDVPALLAAAAVFVLPSHWEGQPLILQEALRAGRPVVATRVGGVPELAGPDAALLVPPGDAAALAAAIRSVLSDQALAARLAAAALRRATSLPSAADATRAALHAYATPGSAAGQRAGLR
jgi:glycosyltransferase involved in cell wall biosynthesis